MPDLLLTLDDVAESLIVSRRTVERLVQRGRIRVVRIGRATRVTPREYEAFLSSCDGR